MRSQKMILTCMPTTQFVLFLLLCTLTLAAQNDQEISQARTRIKATVDVVPLSVMVTDRSGQAIMGLKKEDFRVYESGVQQHVSFFSPEEALVSWGLVLDRSGSMRGMIQDVYRAALHVMDEGSEQDEMFIVTFNDEIETVRDFTTDREELERSIVGLNAGGRTALYDAVVFALDYIQRGKHQKKVLVVVTDGEDNSSRFQFRDLMETAAEQNVLVYTTGMGEGMANGIFGLGERHTRKELKKLAEVTGATSHFPADEEQCRETMRKIAHHVSHQYSLAYYPSNPARDGQWRTIQVIAGSQENNSPKYVTRTRSGYYAPRGARAEAKK